MEAGRIGQLTKGSGILIGGTGCITNSSSTGSARKRAALTYRNGCVATGYRIDAEGCRTYACSLGSRADSG